MIISTVLPDLKQLWDETLGDPRVCIAVLDGPVDTAHPCRIVPSPLEVPLSLFARARKPRALLPY